MIGYLRAQIAAAEKEITELNNKIKIAQEELDNCKKLKLILEKIYEDSFNSSNYLNTTAKSLNNGIIIDGMGQGEKIFDRVNKLSQLSNYTNIAISNVQKRIEELEQNILTWKNRISSLEQSIASWQAEIARLEELERMRAEAEAELKRQGYLG